MASSSDPSQFTTLSQSQNSKLFREYIGAMWNGVTFTSVPINREVEIHLILAFAVDRTDVQPHTPTEGQFNVFWDTNNFTPDQVLAIKQNHPNVRVALSLGGASLGSGPSKVKVVFTAQSAENWVNNAVSSLTNIINTYHLDGLDVDYENFEDKEDTGKFTECIGKLIKTLKQNGVIKFASIAPFYDDGEPNLEMYSALWNQYQNDIDYVNYQFFVLGPQRTVAEYIAHYHEFAAANFGNTKVLGSFCTNGTRIRPDRALDACRQLKNENLLRGMFLWCADDSMGNGFTYEMQCQALLTE